MSKCKTKTLILKNRIKETRQKMNLTQEELANMVGTTKNTIARIEREEHSPSAYIAGLISLALCMPPEKLYYYEVIEK